MLFADRFEAGRRLAERLEPYAGREDVVVLALPRGGVAVGAEVARALGAPLDVLVVRKLGVPGQEELAMGAVAGGGVQVVDQAVIAELGIDPAQLARASEEALAEVERRERLYRGGRPPLDLRGKTAIVVDDGLATGSTMRAALTALRGRPAKLVAAVPVAPRSAGEWLSGLADEVVCLFTPRSFFAVGSWYEDFSQLTDEEVQQLLRSASAPAEQHP